MIPTMPQRLELSRQKKDLAKKMLDVLTIQTRNKHPQDDPTQYIAVYYME
jgi:hypothetical protein